MKEKNHSHIKAVIINRLELNLQYKILNKQNNLTHKFYLFQGSIPNCA